MMMIRLDKLYGHTELEPTMEFKDGVIRLGGKVTEYDGEGKVIERHQINCCIIGYDDGPITETEAKILMGES